MSYHRRSINALATMFRRVTIFGVARSNCGLAFAGDSHDSCYPIFFATLALEARRLPILRVTHDAECHWQFLDSRDRVRTPLPVSKTDLVELDASVKGCSIFTSSGRRIGNHRRSLGCDIDVTDSGSGPYIQSKSDP